MFDCFDSLCSRTQHSDSASGQAQISSLFTNVIANLREALFSGFIAVDMLNVKNNDIIYLGLLLGVFESVLSFFCRVGWRAEGVVVVGGSFLFKHEVLSARSNTVIVNC